MKQESLAGSTGLGEQIRRLGFWSVVVFLLSAVASFFIPLDIPNGYLAEHGERVTWLAENREIFILGWLNQIVAMFSLSAVFLCNAWLLTHTPTLRAWLAAFFVALSVMAFIIPKFIAVWTIPLLTDVVVSGGTGSEMANSLLLLLNVSVPFSLYTAFDYLGFWLYSIYGLLVAFPLYDRKPAAVVSSLSAGLYGVSYQALLVLLFLGFIATPDIEAWFLSLSLLLFIHVCAVGIVFKGKAATDEN